MEARFSRTALLLGEEEEQGFLSDLELIHLLNDALVGRQESRSG